MLELLGRHTKGRGRNFSWRRVVLESALRVAYAGEWPAALWSRVPGATAVRVARHAVVLPDAKARPSPLRIGFASDLHFGPTTPERTIDRAFDLLAEAEPDVLVLGGDYVFLDATPAIARALAERVARVPARTKVAVLGNHDLWTDHRLLEDALAGVGVTVLVNASIRLPAPHDDVALIGLDDPWTGAPDGDLAFAGCDSANVRIAVCHAPDGYAHVAGRDVSLYMCGHTHGGQIALPGHRPLVLPYGPYAERWPYGVHYADGTVVFVSRGVGGVEVPMRTYAPPDVAVFDLR